MFTLMLLRIRRWDSPDFMWLETIASVVLFVVVVVAGGSLGLVEFCTQDVALLGEGDAPRRCSLATFAQISHALCCFAMVINALTNVSQIYLYE